MTQVQADAGADAPQTRRERQREATYDEIVRASRDLLAEGAELSLRAVAGRMGMTAPALYRYVANYQELVDLVAFEIDKAATERLRRGRRRAARGRLRRPAGGLGDRVPDVGARATRASSAWSSPTRSPTRSCVRRELLTAVHAPAT